MLKYYIFLFTGVDHQKLTDLAEKYFGNLQPTSEASTRQLMEINKESYFTGSDVS